MNQVRRRTKIIATIGPATESPEMLEQLVLAGVNVVRINMSHATEEQTRGIVATIRELSARIDRHVGILMDTQGPAIRTGDISHSLDLQPGDTFVLTVRGETCEEHHSVDVNYDDLVEDISVGDTVLIDNGEIQLKVLEKRHNQLHCQVLTPGTLGSRRHINLPGVRVNLPALTDKDIKDIELGIELGVDLFAMSFVREAEDVTRLKGILEYRKAPQKIIAKIEDQEGVKNVDEIIATADAIMVARGDLGIECPYEELPIIQRRIVKHCQRVGKPVIVATHMMESMIENPSPTRAEITDVANAVYEQADAIMLSGESTIGEYPVQCVEIMDRIARRAERSGGLQYSKDAVMDTMYAKLIKSATVLAKEVEAEALVVFTEGGKMPTAAAWLRPLHTPVYAFTSETSLVNQLTLLWGITPFLIEKEQDKDVEAALEVLKRKHLVKPGQHIVAVSEVMLRNKMIDTIQVEVVD